MMTEVNVRNLLPLSMNLSSLIDPSWWTARPERLRLRALAEKSD
jgi:hypothetical protein